VIVCELVRSTYFAMDSVFLGPAQRQTIKLNFQPSPSLFVADLLEWVDRVASDEGPRLIQGAGKDGIVAFTAIIGDLADLVQRAMVQGFGGGQVISDTIPAAFSSPRAQRALQALAKQLAETKADADRIKAPRIGDAELQGLNNSALLNDILERVKRLQANGTNDNGTGGKGTNGVVHVNVTGVSPGNP
jgi:hypothetical protein